MTKNNPILTLKSIANDYS